jgi:1,2-dihydroxy-3-keto-5-methylthiopentene dioxygenase
MVRAWYMDDDPGDQRTEHHRNPPKFLSLEELYKISGVEYFKVTVMLTLRNKNITQKNCS